MTLRLACVAAVLACPFGAAARGQTAAVTGPTVGGNPVPLARIGGGDPFGPAVAAATDPLAPPPPPAAWSGNIGFSYLRPYWAGSGLSLRAPALGNPAVAVVSPYGDLSSNFGFVPRVDLHYDPAGLGFGTAVGAQFINVGGNLERTVSLTGPAPGTADLIASYNLSILIVDIAQVNRTVRLGDVTAHPLVAHLGREDDTFTFSIGTRYGSIRQAWNATLRGGTTFASADATQTFSGLGLTAGLATDHPWAQRWGFYSNNRVSLLVGPNNRKSVANGTDVGGPFSNSLVENRTILLPAVEAEVGVRYLTPLDERRWQADGTGPLLSVRVGAVGQFWGGTGFLPAAAGDAQFNNRPLYLVGVTVLAGVEF